MKPEIVIANHAGFHNSDLKKTNERLASGKTYQNLSTVIVTPTRGGRSLTPRFVSSIMGLIKPMNQQCVGPIFVAGMEVGDAFNSAIEMILANPQLSKFKFLMTIEDDNLCPPDILLRLYESIHKFDVVGGIYHTKGPEGQPQIYGNPNESPLNFIPQRVQENAIQPCNGTGMGCALFRMELFKKMPRPWFVTQQTWDPNSGAKCMTQDLYFYEKLVRAGGKVAVDTRVKVGHFCELENIVW